MTPVDALGGGAATESHEPLAETTLAALLKRDRAIVSAGVVGLCATAWAYTTLVARGMASTHAGMSMPGMHAWGAVDLLFLFSMWAVMMVAMMLPSATPMLLLFATVNRRRRARGSPFVPNAVFLLGYLLVWSLYAALAASAQLMLHNAALLSPRMVSASPMLGGVLLVAAGIFQWTPLKQACLRQCRSPLHFLTTEWREGRTGALVMGLRHGSYCVGCCWLLMALLFVGGVMNLLWVAALAALVLVEKVSPWGRWVGWLAGAVLVGWGAWMLAVAGS